MPKKIFFSWQSDVVNDLKEKLKSLMNDEWLLETAVRQDDSAVDIPNTIFQKIEECDLFIADLTIVGCNEKKSLPNPNVMFELGYAVGKLGWEKIIILSDSPNELPFDVRHRNCKKTNISKEELLSVLLKQLKGQLERLLAKFKVIQKPTKLPATVGDCFFCLFYVDAQQKDKIFDIDFEENIIQHNFVGNGVSSTFSTFDEIVNSLIDRTNCNIPKKLVGLFSQKDTASINVIEKILILKYNTFTKELLE